MRAFTSIVSLAGLAGSLLGVVPAVAQTAAQPGKSASFMTLAGKDTVGFEQYSRKGNTITGVWVTMHQGVFVHDYVISVGANGNVVHYEFTIDSKGVDGIAHHFRAAANYTKDSVVYDLMSDGTTIAKTFALKDAVPVLGASLVTWELALAALRSTRTDSATLNAHAVNLPNAEGQTIPVKLYAQDSARVAGNLMARFDRDGRLIEWRAGPAITTRVAPFDMPGLIAAFRAADAPRAAAAAAALAARVEVPMVLAQKQRFVGEYALNPSVALSVTLDGEKLMIQLGGQPALQLFPQSPTSFFLKVPGDQQIEFEFDSSGAAAALTLIAGERRQRAVKTT
jgi:hypothetical protein